MLPRSFSVTFLYFYAEAAEHLLPGFDSFHLVSAAATDQLFMHGSRCYSETLNKRFEIVSRWGRQRLISLV